MLTINNTENGYIQNLEIKGNTIQSSENLADIKSCGDKVEGQELYKIPLLCCGNNLIASDKIVLGAINDDGTDRVGTSTRIEYTKVKSNTIYTLSRNGVARNSNIFYYDSSKKIINKDSVVKATFTTPSNCVYVRFFFGSSLEDNIQLEEGTVATPYEPYQEHKITILSPTQLEKVGDVADRIIEKDGVWGVEKNIEKLIVSSLTSGWSMTGDLGNTVMFVRSGMGALKPNVKCFSNIAKGVDSHSKVTTLDEECLYISTNDIYIRLSKARCSNVSEFLSYINTTNVYLLIQAKSPTFIPLPHDQQVKLKTFANKTNISFLTEIEGTIKGEVPKSLGATVNTHTTQIDNLNKELDRVKKLEKSTVSTVETESSFTVVEETSNGYFEDVKLEGKTLVNLLKSNITRELTNDRFAREYANPNRVQATVTFTNFSDKPISITVAEGNKYKRTITCKSRKSTLISLTTTEQLADFVMFISDSWTKEEADKLDTFAILLEGDHTQNPPSYFEGLKSVGEGTDKIVVSSVNENLFDESKVLYDKGINSIDGNVSSVTDWCVNTDYIRVGNNEIYYINRGNSISNSTSAPKYIYVYQYNKDKSFVNRIEVGTTSNIFTTSVDGFIRITAKYNELVDFGVYRNQGVSVSHKTDKKQLLYYDPQDNTWKKPTLREWDSVEKHSDGKYYYHKRSGEKTLNGNTSEQWQKYTSTNEVNTIAFILPISGHVDTWVNNNVICNLFKSINNSIYSQDAEGIALDNKGIIIKILRSKLETQDVEGFKKRLQANNVTVVYQLAQEEMYECTNIDLITYSGETNFMVESGVLSPKSTLKVHNNISNVVTLLQNKVSLLEQNVSNYMITQNRLQLGSTYSADSITFKVDYSDSFINKTVEPYDTDLYNLILNNILIGKENYDYDKMFNIIMDYASWSQISWEQFDMLVGVMDLQHNPPEPPIEEMPEETPQV